MYGMLWRDTYVPPFGTGQLREWMPRISRNKLGPLGKPGGLIFWQETYTLSYHFSGETEAQKEEITWPALPSYRYFLTLFKLNLIGLWGWSWWRSQQTFAPLPNVLPRTASTDFHRVSSCVAQWECRREVRATFMVTGQWGWRWKKNLSIFFCSYY